MKQVVLGADVALRRICQYRASDKGIQSVVEQKETRLARWRTQASISSFRLVCVRLYVKPVPRCEYASPGVIEEL